MINITEKYETQIKEMVDACHRLGELGYVTSSGGNISYRVDNELILITPTKTPKRTMRFEDICAIDINGNIVYAAKGKKPTGETPLHTYIMRRRPDVSVVVHAHPPILTGFAIAGDSILSEPFLPEPVIEIGPLLLIPYAEPLSEELANMLDKYIEDSNAFLMENHGVLICGHSVFETVEQLQMAECMALSVLVAMQLKNPKPIKSSDLKRLDNVIKQRSLPIPAAKGKFASIAQLYEKGFSKACK